MDHWPQRRGVCDPKGQNVFGVRVHHGHYFRSRLKDASMDEAFKIEGTRFLLHRRTVECKGNDVAMGDESWGHRTSKEKIFRSVRMTDANMAIGVNHILMGEYAVGN